MKKDKPKFTRQEIESLSAKIAVELGNFCWKFECEVKLDLLVITYAPKIIGRRIGPFGVKPVDIAGEKISQLQRNNYFSLRKDCNGLIHNGSVNKDLIHTQTGISVNLRMIE